MNLGFESVPLKGVRGMIADRMLESLQSSAQLTHHCRADATAMLAEKNRLTESNSRVSIEDLVNHSVVKALKKHPYANGRIENQTVQLHHSIDLSVAISIQDNQLVAPTIFHAEDMNITELRAARQDLAEKAKSNKLTVTEMTGGTFTVSNLGLTRVEFFTPIINLPQICILGIGRIVDHPVREEDGSVGFKPFIGLSLTFDHRALDGAPAGNFLTTLCNEIEGTRH